MNYRRRIKKIERNIKLSRYSNQVKKITKEEEIEKLTIVLEDCLSQGYFQKLPEFNGLNNEEIEFKLEDMFSSDRVKLNSIILDAISWWYHFGKRRLHCNAIT